MSHFIKAVFSHFFNSDTFSKGAVLAYYTVFSLFPIIIVLISILGLIFGKDAMSGDIYLQLKESLGNEAALQIQDIIKNQHIHHNSFFTAIIGSITLVLSASGMFNQIHNALNGIWGIKATPRNGITHFITRRIVSFSILMLLSFILVLSTTINSFLLKHSVNLHVHYKFLYLYEHIFSFFIISLIFAIMFKLLSDAKVHWKPAIVSGLFTGFLFLFGKVGIGIYLGKMHVSTTFGSASVLALIMLWVYYTSQILFIGASFTKIVSHRMNYKILPKKNSILINKD